MLEKLQNNSLIREVDLGDGIHSFNFTRKAFWDSKWNEQTITARGLFVDVNKGEVFARSYNKFFNIEERPETEERNLRNSLEYPVTLYRKENGYLGILSVKNGELWYASKSTDKSDFAKWFKKIMETKYRPWLNTLKNWLEYKNCSAIFEVVDMVNDPHIVDYGEGYQDVYLLDLVSNDFDFKLEFNYDDLRVFCDRFINFKVKKCDFVAFCWEDLITWIHKHQAEDTGIEGWVACDANGYMFKIKTDWYKFWKAIRQMGQRIYSGKSIEQIRNNPRYAYNVEAAEKAYIVYKTDYDFQIANEGEITYRICVHQVRHIVGTLTNMLDSLKGLVL